jgi:hypothetical protein
LGLFFSVFGTIFVAELPDKTALAALVLGRPGVAPAAPPPRCVATRRSGRSHLTPKPWDRAVDHGIS